MNTLSSSPSTGFNSPFLITDYTYDALAFINCTMSYASHHHGMSGGGVILILFFVLLAVYLGGGAIYAKKLDCDQ